MIKIAAAAAGAALLAGIVVLLPGMTPMVAAGTSLSSINTQAKSDRLDFTYDAGCKDRGWPYYDASCLRRDDNSPAKVVRIVTTDRLPASIRFATSR